MRQLLLVSLGFGLVSCQREAGPAPSVDIREERVAAADQIPAPEPVPPGARLPGPPPPPPPAPSIGGLLPITRAAIERELEPGAGCSLDGNGTSGPLLVAVTDDAIVNLAGRIVHLKPKAADLATLFRGGQFVGQGVTVEVDREGEVERADEVTTWQATLHVRSGDTGFTSFHHRWSCGA